MSKPVYVNGSEIYTQYKARLLDYRVGPPTISNSYMSRTTSVIPVKLKESIGTRSIELDLEFEGDDCHDSLLHISDMTALLLNENELKLPDGFEYFCILDKVSSPTLEGDTFYSVTFTLEGYRHGEMQTAEFTKSGSVFALGNCKAPAIITIENATGTVSVNDITVNNISSKVVIDGYKKTVMAVSGVTESNKFKDCVMTKFPSLNPGTNMITISGTAKVTVAYTPIYL